MADVLTSRYLPTSASAVGDTLYEDVEGVIQSITPHKTPFIASIGKTKVPREHHEWLEDTLVSPDGTNAAVEGADAEATVRTIPSRLENYTQILQDTFMVSGSQDAQDLIGAKSASSYHLEKSLKYLNTELEYNAINNTTASAGTSSGARTMKGLAGFVATNDESFASEATNNLFTETKLMKMSQDIYGACEDDNHILLVAPGTAAQIADWDQSSRITVNTNASDKELIMAVMVIETPFGRIRIVLDRYIADTIDTSTSAYYKTAFLYEPGKISVGWFRNWKSTKLAKTGDAEKTQTVGEATLVVHSEKAAAKCGSIYDRAS